MLGILLCAMLAAPSDQTFFIGWETVTDAAAKSGKAAGQSADFWAQSLAGMIARQLDSKYPCGSTMDQSDLTTLLDFERRRQLLGGAEDGRLLGVAGALGARTLIGLRITVARDTVLVNAVANDVPTTKATTRKIATIPIDESSAGALQQFASQFVASLGESVPRCKGRGWAGSVTVSYEAKGASADGRESEEGSGSLTCKLVGEGDAAKCSYSSAYVLRGSGGTMNITKVAKDTPVSVSASLAGGKFTLQIGTVPVTTSMKASGIILEPQTEDLPGDTYEVPAGPDPNSQSGSWAPPALGNMKINVTWSLTRPPGKH